MVGPATPTSRIMYSAHLTSCCSRRASRAAELIRSAEPLTLFRSTPYNPTTMKHVNSKLIQLSLFSAISIALTTNAQAALVLINNPSFETPVTANATFSGAQASAPSGWTVYNSGATNSMRFFGVWNPSTTNSFLSGAPHGANVGVVFLQNTTNLAEAGLRQVLTSNLQLSTQYTLTVEVGNFSDFDSGPFNFTGFPGYRIDLFAGSTLLASDNNTLSPAEGIFATSSISFTSGVSHANAGQALSIRLVNLNGSGIEVNFDNVRLDAVAIPEPSSTALLAGAVVTIFVCMRRRKNK